MATQREKDAAGYLKKHRVMELMDNLSGLLFFYRPGQSFSSRMQRMKIKENGLKQTYLIKVTQLELIARLIV